MSFDTGSIIDARFEVEGLCSDTGGMGSILFVKDLSIQTDAKLVLKYCKSDDPEYAARFKREVRLSKKFEANPKIVNIIHSNTEFVPPYFVMKYYENGDLTNMVASLDGNHGLQEQTLCSMIDCIQVLHEEGIYHRDIKPQNFLLGGTRDILVSDFGLGVELNSASRITDTSSVWGTYGYLPPEFNEGGFKFADAKGDIYMLGKSFYVLLTKKSPEHLQPGGLHPVLFSVIEKACAPNKDMRHNNLEELKAHIIMAYDVILGRGKNPYIEAQALLRDIIMEFDKSHLCQSEKIISFLQKLTFSDEAQQLDLCSKLPVTFFSAVDQKESATYLENFLKIYEKMVEKADYPFHFAETIAKNMQVIFIAENIDYSLKAFSLKLAIRAAYLMNRFDAMDVCKRMICSVSDDNLGIYISAILINNGYEFIQDIELSDCKCDSIIKVISAIKE